MLVSNHVSYLDIFVVSAAVPCVFIAKKEIESWPLFGMMSHFAGSIFVDRGLRSDVHRVGERVLEVLNAGVVTVLFPEGTSSDGAQVLPFRSPFFEFAVSTGASLRPAYLSYELDGGDVTTEVAFWGEMSMVKHVFNLLSKKQIRARIRFGEGMRAMADRKRTALLMHEEVVALAQHANTQRVP